MNGSDMTNAEAAQAIARALGPVLPVCYTDDPGDCACGGYRDEKTGEMLPHTGHDIGKAPIGKLVPNGWKNATTNSATIDRWWRAHPRANIALALPLGKKGFIDPDSPAALVEAEGLGVAGGRRRESRNVGFIFSRPDDCPVVNITKSGDGTDLEIRADGYAVVWGVHANGTPVRIDLSAPLVDLPAWAVERLKKKAAAKAAQDAARASRRAERLAQGVVGDEPLWTLDDVALERWNGDLFPVDDHGNLDRSRALWHIGLDLAEAGATVAGIRWAVENRDNALGWAKYTDRSDADVRYDEIAEKTFEWVASRQRGPRIRFDQFKQPEGSDSAVACHCGLQERVDDLEAEKVALLELLREYKAAEQLEQHGPFSPAETRVVKHLEQLTTVALANGHERMTLLREDVARLALGDRANVKAVSRGWKAYEAYQDDPEISATLPFRLKRRVDAKGHEHVDLYPVIPEQPQTRTDRLLALAKLPRDLEARPRPGGDQREKPKRPGACPRCDSPMKRTTVDVCTSDTCGCVVNHPAKIVGRDPSESEAEGHSVPGRVTMNGAAFDLAAIPTHNPEGHFVPPEESTYTGQNVPRPAISFVSRDDAELAAGPRLHLVEDDPPVAPAKTGRWRCHCGSFERYPRASGGYRCDGCGHIEAPVMMGASE